MAWMGKHLDSVPRQYRTVRSKYCTVHTYIRYVRTHAATAWNLSSPSAWATPHLCADTTDMSCQFRFRVELASIVQRPRGKRKAGEPDRPCDNMITPYEYVLYVQFHTSAVFDDHGSRQGHMQ